MSEKVFSALVGVVVCALVAAVLDAFAFLVTGGAFNAFGRVFAAVLLAGSLPVGVGMGLTDYASEVNGR